MDTLSNQIAKEAKRLNTRLSRLQKEDLPSTSFPRIDEGKKFRPNYFTQKGNVSGGSKGMSNAEKQAKLKWIRGILSETETVPEARKNVAEKAKQWHVTPEEAKRRIKLGRVFYQAVGYAGGHVFDSERVHNTIEEFSQAPAYNHLIDQLFIDYGFEMQDEAGGSEQLLDWMNATGIIPNGVRATRNDSGQIVYID